MSQPSFNNLLVELGPDSDEIKSLIASDFSSFRKDVRRLIRELTKDPLAERQLKLNDSRCDSSFFIKTSNNSNLLFSSENFAKKRPWDDVNCFTLQVERRQLNPFVNSDELNEPKSTAKMTDILESLSRIESAIQKSGETPTKVAFKSLPEQHTPKRTSEKPKMQPTNNVCQHSPKVKSAQPSKQAIISNQQPSSQEPFDKSSKRFTSKKLYLDHFDRIIDLVVAGLDDFSSEKLNTAADFIIEPPKKQINEVTVHEFEAFKNALILSESPFSKKQKKESQKRSRLNDGIAAKENSTKESISKGLVFDESCEMFIDSPIKKSDKSKHHHHNLSVPGSSLLSDHSSNDVQGLDSFTSVSSSKKHKKHRHHHRHDRNDSP